MTFEARHSVDRGLHHLARRLDPIIGAELSPSLGGLPWPTVLSELDKMRGKPPKSYAATDLQSQLKTITERLGNLGFPFDDHTRLVSALGSELRIVRNRWAHHDELTTLDAWRTHDFVVRLLEHFGDAQGVAGANELRDEAFNALAEEKGVATYVAPSNPAAVATPKPAAELPTAAEVVRPDPSVLTRTDSASTPTIGSGRDEFEPWMAVLVEMSPCSTTCPRRLPKRRFAPSPRRSPSSKDRSISHALRSSPRRRSAYSDSGPHARRS